MDSLAVAIHDFLSCLSSASFPVWFPFAAHGLLALYSYLEHAFIFAAEWQDPPTNLETLREAILSDPVLTKFMARAGVHDTVDQENEQVARAFLVFVEMVLMDRGVQECATWFAHNFDPIIFAAFAAGDACQPASKPPSKRAVPFGDEGGSNARRQRTEVDPFEAEPPTTTLLVLQRLRQRQMLSAPANSTYELSVVLGSGSIPSEPYMEPTVSSEMSVDQASPVVDSSLSPTKATSPAAFHNIRSVTGIAGKEDVTIALKWCQENPTAVFLNAISTAQSEADTTFFPMSRDSPSTAESPTTNAAPDVSDASPITPPRPRLSTTSEPLEPLTSSPPYITLIDDPVAEQDLEAAAVSFVDETIQMVKRGELLPTPKILLPVPKVSTETSTKSSSKASVTASTASSTKVKTTSEAHRGKKRSRSTSDAPKRPKNERIPRHEMKYLYQQRNKKTKVIKDDTVAIPLRSTKDLKENLTAVPLRSQGGPQRRQPLTGEVKVSNAPSRYEKIRTLQSRLARSCPTACIPDPDPPAAQSRPRHEEDIIFLPYN
ncbi:hypothetical protein C8R43DRAFT_981250 [Mycena crocata]|nr:hypothetical protein C8R43DRAFT_981250 [Mycena crocata]